MSVALVTGGAGAIGAAVCGRLAAAGHRVAVADLEASAAEAAATALGGDGHLGLAMDVADTTEVRRGVERITAELGPVDVLVNVAGVFFTHRITELPEDDWDLLLDVNLKGTFLTCKTFLPAMIDRGGGCIVNIASTAGIRGGRERAAYCASKGGVVLLTRSLALDHGRDGVRINCVCPGLIDTGMAEWLKRDAKAFRAWERSIPAQRVGHVEDIAAAVSYLVSPGADYVRGAAFVVDGGDSA
jgi:NAD(P)-dependent dehydrogenase (short-subunit alcohol dehydrogenase family)